MEEGGTAIRYIGWSMYPTFFPHDILICREIPINALNCGDIVAIRSEEPYYGLITVHRICEIKEGKIITRGDNTDRPDKEPVTLGNFVGVVVKVRRRENEFSIRSGLLGYAKHRFLLWKRYAFRSLEPAIVQLEKLSSAQQPLKNLIPHIIPGRIVGIRTPGGIDLQLFLHDTLIGWLVYNGVSWYIRPIFRPFVDSQSLPTSYKSAFPDIDLDEEEFS